MKYLQQRFYHQSSPDDSTSYRDHGPDAAVWRLFKWFLIGTVAIAIPLVGLIYLVNSSAG